MPGAGIMTSPFAYWSYSPLFSRVIEVSFLNNHIFIIANDENMTLVW